MEGGWVFDDSSGSGESSSGDCSSTLSSPSARWHGRGGRLGRGRPRRVPVAAVAPEHVAPSASAVVAAVPLSDFIRPLGCPVSQLGSRTCIQVGDMPAAEEPREVAHFLVEEDAASSIHRNAEKLNIPLRTFQRKLQTSVAAVFCFWHACFGSLASEYVTAT